MDRRRHPRAPLGTDAQVISAGDRHLCVVQDVSAGGAAILCRPEVRLDRFVQIDFFLPDVAQWFSVEATVVYRAGSVSGSFGLAFHSPDSWTVSHVQRYVARQMD